MNSPPDWSLEKDQEQVLPRVTALLFSHQLVHFFPVLLPVDFDSCQCFLVFLISCFSFCILQGEGLSSYRCQGLCDPCWHWDILCCLSPDFESASGCDIPFLFCSFHFEITADSPNPGKSGVLFTQFLLVVTSFNVIVQYPNQSSDSEAVMAFPLPWGFFPLPFLSHTHFPPCPSHPPCLATSHLFSISMTLSLKEYIDYVTLWDWMFPLSSIHSPVLCITSLFSSCCWVTVDASFPGGWVVKCLPANAGEAASSPWSESSPGGGNDYPLQYSFCGKSHGRRSLAGYSPRSHKQSDRTEWLSTHIFHEWTTLLNKRG